jgi:hypothetical protein
MRSDAGTLELPDRVWVFRVEHRTREALVRVLAPTEHVARLRAVGKLPTAAVLVELVSVVDQERH